jgi:transcriptional regulator
MPNKPPSAVPERTMTARARVREALLGPPVSAHEISDRAGVPEKDVASHLEHLQRSSKQRGERLVVKPAECLSCGYVFRGREKLTAPGSCPTCRKSHIASPLFHLESG